MRILEHHFLKEITVEKAPREIPPLSPSSPPPLPSPAVNHPPHAKMKHTKEADALVTEFAARCQLFRTYSPTPTNNNCMKQKLSNNSI